MTLRKAALPLLFVAATALFSFAAPASAQNLGDMYRGVVENAKDNIAKYQKWVENGVFVRQKSYDLCAASYKDAVGAAQSAKGDADLAPEIRETVVSYGESLAKQGLNGTCPPDKVLPDQTVDKGMPFFEDASKQLDVIDRFEALAKNMKALAGDKLACERAVSAYVEDMEKLEDLGFPVQDIDALANGVLAHRQSICSP